MKQLFNTPLLLLLLVPALVFANNDKFKGKYTKEKKINKEYSVNANAGLRVNNSYGNIDIVTWSENRTVIEVTIKTNGDDEEMVKKRLDEITVDFTANGSLVTATTNFGNKKKNNSWSWWGDGNKNKKVSMEVNYKIKLPKTNTVDLDNDYGAININDLDGNAKINCDYGQLIIGSLNAEDNYLNFDYTNKSAIGFMKSGKINADYSSFSLGKTESLELTADYTKSEIGTVTNINYNCDYGKVQIGKAGDIIGRGDYVNQSIGTVSGSINLNTDYGSISIDRLTSTAKDVTIRSEYTGVKLGYDSGYSFNFIINLEYAGLNGEENLVVTKSSKDGSDKSYEGYHGNNNSGNTMNINSDYGGVTLKKY
ncbi:hypothetical protein [Patiriisocius hiemis]|uniref:Adhesin domain-containing protein n=1 Tax=Patiriisocius hiemis TaxID=3075604 RepID=A0ABU2Y9W3_9FLAO|nr:hypothetical protein [Constantimarinum sp. W242]MDT0554973.1 hypothetical protein [Constantimarinum sp. W242]